MRDLIYRQAAIDELSERQRKLIYCFGFENDMVKIMEIAKSIIIAIPSAQPERKRGKWIEANTHIYGIYECTACKAWTYIPNEPRDYSFCPRCGADMREVDDE